MQIELRYLSEKDKKEICGWKYAVKSLAFVTGSPRK